MARAGYQVVSETGVVVLDQWTAPSVDFRELVASGNNARVALTHVGLASDPTLWITNPVRGGQFPVDIAWETVRHPDGRYTVRALVADGARNEARREQVVVLDNEKPRVAEVTATPAEAEPGRTVTVRIQFTEPVLPASVKVTAGRVEVVG